MSKLYIHKDESKFHAYEDMPCPWDFIIRRKVRINVHDAFDQKIYNARVWLEIYYFRGPWHGRNYMVYLTY